MNDFVRNFVFLSEEIIFSFALFNLFVYQKCVLKRDKEIFLKCPIKGFEFKISLNLSISKVTP